MSIRHRVIREVVTDVFEGKLKAIGEAECVGESIGLIAKEGLHFLRALEMALVVFCQARPGRIQMGVFANAGKNIEHLAPGRTGMENSIGGEEGKPMMFSEINQLAIDPFLAPNEMALQLDIDAIAAKGLEQMLCMDRELGSTGRRPVICGGSPQTGAHGV
jgi:hypothetical protein